MMSDIEREAVMRDKSLAWELYHTQPSHPRIPELAQSVLAREPSFTGMIILTALHRIELGEYAAARTMLQGLAGQRDRQYVNVLRELRDLEYIVGDYAESLRLAELVLREEPGAKWEDLMEQGIALAMDGDLDAGWRVLDEAVALAAKIDADSYRDALAWRATRQFISGAPPERFLTAAQAAIDADPSDTVSAVLLGFAYVYRYEPEKAQALFLGVLRQDPTDDLARIGHRMTRGILESITQAGRTIDDHRWAGTGELAWRMLYERMLGAGLHEAFAALDAVMPVTLSASLHPPLPAAEADEFGATEAKVFAWHDGQLMGTGTFWGTGEHFRLMTSEEVAAMDQAIAQDPQSWSPWVADTGRYEQLFTDDAGGYLYEGFGGRLYRRGPEGTPDVEVALSLADWLWQRVVAFGGKDPRPGGGRTAVRTSA